MNKVYRHYIFHCCVQGVEFRYTACYTARNYGISVWVENLDDGSGEMEAEGRPVNIDTLIDSLENLRQSYVDRIESKNITLHGDYGFDIITLLPKYVAVTFNL